jgi:hypothetical protein
MKSKATQKRYWEMPPNQLAEATKEFDKEFAADKFHPMTPADRKRWERAKSKTGGVARQAGLRRISVRVEKELLERSDTLAKRKGLSRDSLFARALKTVLMADGEDAPE